MFELAFSRRICCSRVCSAMRRAVLPCASTDTPMIRPGAERLSLSLNAKYAACGPPKPIGIPKRCVLPKAISAPMLAGDLSRTRLRMSLATMAYAPFSLTAEIMSVKSTTSPSLPTYWKYAPKKSPFLAVSKSPTTTSKPKYLARVRITSRVCG